MNGGETPAKTRVGRATGAGARAPIGVAPAASTAVVAAALLTALQLAPRAARADGLGELPAPRAIGRAGTGVVSDDGAGAVLTNPGGLARRDVTRGQVALTVADADLEYVAPDPTAPPIRDVSHPVLAPTLAVETSLGRFTLGAALAIPVARERRLPVPQPAERDPAVIRLYPHRYAGMSSRLGRRTAAIGAAWRATDWLAIGASLSASQLIVEERRRLWAGFDGVDVVGTPGRDVDLALGGRDDFVPGGALGVLVAPQSAPLELALSATASARAHAVGAARATMVALPGVAQAAPSARVDVAAPLAVHAGARWLGERWALELEGDLWRYPRSASQPTWRVGGIDVIDPSTREAPVGRVPALLAQRSHGAVRLAVDAEVVAGFVWLTAGYAWSGAPVPAARQNAAFADVGGHTVSLGAEISTGGVTITAGAARTMAWSMRVDDPAIPIVNPFDPGTTPANGGRYDTGRDVIGVSAELAFD